MLLECCLTSSIYYYFAIILSGDLSETCDFGVKILMVINFKF